ncbi:MAG: SGNH/GDSL hydrolase family protein [Lachnospiraceae bacterium]|nr:SGNH/GDSL hydrolase family protein [Lachnospiraceae bacterium]
MKRILSIVTAVLLTLSLTACGGKKEPGTNATETPSVTETPTDSPTPTNSPSPSPSPTPEVDEQQVWYDGVIASSLVQTGNNCRLRKVIEKAQRGEDVYIGFIGGSITEGEGCSYPFCYAMQTMKHFAEDYGTGENVHIINAGVSGTPSTLGVIRYERDLIEKNDGHLPDLLIIEFAVNDADDPTNGATYEGLIRRALYAENEPAVVLLFSVFQSKWNLQERFIPMGKHYNLPMVSIKNAVVPCLNNFTITNSQFFNDQYHPKLYGHTIMADCLRYLFKTAMEETPSAADEEKKAAYMSDAFDHVTMITSKSTDVKVNAGGFSETDVSIGTTRYDNAKTFPDNWKHTKDTGNAPLSFTVNAKTILLTYKKSSSESFGKVDVYLDGQKVMTIDGHDAGGWNNPYTAVILNSDTVASHKVEVRMAQGSEQSDFTIMAFGYGD